MNHRERAISAVQFKPTEGLPFRHACGPMPGVLERWDREGVPREVRRYNRACLQRVRPLLAGTSETILSLAMQDGASFSRLQPAAGAGFGSARALDATTAGSRGKEDRCLARYVSESAAVMDSRLVATTIPALQGEARP